MACELPRKAKALKGKQGTLIKITKDHKSIVRIWGQYEIKLVSNEESVKVLDKKQQEWKTEQKKKKVSF